ncbi:DUF6152 family protein [Vineibacter terrae]|uniref:Uncharacterized protein n=1 Tax=Vineibacter terrae TaxID=2586908 RepID=A0A5C8P9C2_9HYPH|nr:DUF6152 family protein [Vineibacter terrae]TXL70003.1 hypothetical protein FHP25_36420 [Vineibacter terrae]HEX2892061.1 DUF6152 family protein [Vineibacter terrae]
MRQLVLVASLAVALPAAAFAHHGWSSYDANTVLTLTAPVLESRYQNPHGELVLEDQGKRWLVVLAPPSRMQSRGLPREAIAVGKAVVVVGYPSRTTQGEMRAERITVDGKTVELR